MALTGLITAPTRLHIEGVGKALSIFAAAFVLIIWVVLIGLLCIRRILNRSFRLTKKPIQIRPRFRGDAKLRLSLRRRLQESDAIRCHWAHSESKSK